MKYDIKHIDYLFALWRKDNRAIAAIEFALVFPILFLMFIGIWDVGNALLVGQKVIYASQIAADLISREISVSEGEVEEAVIASQLAIAPFPINDSNFYIEIISVSFDEDEEAEVVWEYTMDGQPVPDDLVDKAEQLAIANDGLLVVRVRYHHEPMFSDMVIGDINIVEEAYVRGRRVPVVGADWI